MTVRLQRCTVSIVLKAYILQIQDFLPYYVSEYAGPGKPSAIHQHKIGMFTQSRNMYLYLFCFIIYNSS